ncbi:histidine-tRNA ligase, cytoplasmic-like protein [Euroglyphus maynei]|uniref:histidine--tRNA ligase n=1 Tax=Euroglyphus maynei TaxID=6958 RepID=A0A1Y3BGK7_EURMA|nr:histidine-tRNA ligase, cytoplasmic-like protein [Euroglyphus maynei]
MDDNVTLETQIKHQGDLVRSLKSQKVDKAMIDAEVSKLLALKARLNPPSDDKRSSPVKKDDRKDNKKFTLKTPKGMRDFESKQMLVREKVFKTISDIFKRHGGLAIDTPVCERKDINHRCILDGLFEVCGVPEEKFRTICSSVDKLDKNTWEEVKQEMVKEKGLSENVADSIGELVKMNGSIELVDRLLAQELGQNKRAAQGLNEIKSLFHYCNLFQIESSISFDLSLARGLDYYTGLIYEVVITDKNVECGSIAAGGRYDNLVGMLAETNNWEVPCVGLSIGIERILTIIEERMSGDDGVGSPTQVLVASIGNELLDERMKILVELWNAKLNAEHIYKKSIKILNNYQYCETNRIPYAVILAEDELKRGMVKIRNIQTRKEV